MNSTKIPQKLNADIAELFGALIGDGCLSKYYSNYSKKYVYCILFTGHTHDTGYYENVVRSIFMKEFGIKGCIRPISQKKAIRFETNSKRVFEFFQMIGIPSGKKTNLKIPKSVMKNNDLAVACVRGIFDTDGSVYRRYSKKYANHKTKYDYLNVEFKITSLEVINQIKEVLEKSEIKTSKIRKNKESYVLNIFRQEGVRMFFKIIKPSNKYHTERFLNVL